jgi:hypothetical protein
MTEEDILQLIESDSEMMAIIRAVKKLGLKDWWVGAGFVRSKVWDYLHGFKNKTPLPDVDVAYFDRSDFTETEAAQESTKVEDDYQKILRELIPNINWSVTNQARMHLVHHTKPYSSSTDAISEWVETATSIAVSLDDNNQLILTSPHGIEDLVNLIIRPTPWARNNMDEFNRRLEKKSWPSKWPLLKVSTS